ncbi:MAG: YhcH/YjgK/YiaL family protein [Ginsengibacter sp.]
MKNIISLLFVFFVIAISSRGFCQTDWSGQNAKKWFKQEEWLGGVKLKPHSSVNVKEFAKQYHLNKSYWDKAFAFIKNNDLENLPVGKYPIDDDNVFASITEDTTRDFDKTKWESHRRYIDLQYVIEGEEKIGVAEANKATVVVPYDEKKDLANYNAEGPIYDAVPGTFFIFFSNDAHRPLITPGGNKVEKKLVIKIKAAE